MLIKTFPPIKIFVYKSLCTPESHMMSGSLSTHLLMCLQWLHFSVDKYLLSNECQSLKVPLIQVHGLEMRRELPSVVTQVVTSSQSGDSELHTLQQNELLVAEKEDGQGDSGGKKILHNITWGKFSVTY